jgi:hypothetical protein
MKLYISSISSILMPVIVFGQISIESVSAVSPACGSYSLVFLASGLRGLNQVFIGEKSPGGETQDPLIKIVAAPEGRVVNGQLELNVIVLVSKPGENPNETADTTVLPFDISAFELVYNDGKTKKSIGPLQRRARLNYMTIDLNSPFPNCHISEARIEVRNSAGMIAQILYVPIVTF